MVHETLPHAHLKVGLGCDSLDEVSPLQVGALEVGIPAVC